MVDRDRYVDRQIVEANLGQGFIAAIDALPGIDLDQIIETATATIQSFMQNSGYPVVSTQDPSQVEQRVQNAVLMAVWIAVTSIPAVSITLPANYKEHPAYVAYRGIVSGETPLVSQPSQSGAVGGMKLSNGPAGQSGTLVQRSSRSNLAGY